MSLAAGAVHVAAVHVAAVHVPDCPEHADGLVYCESLHVPQFEVHDPESPAQEPVEQVPALLQLFSSFDPATLHNPQYVAAFELQLAVVQSSLSFLQRA